MGGLETNPQDTPRPRFPAKRPLRGDPPVPGATSAVWRLTHGRR
jgi:hypothetical protein